MSSATVLYYRVCWCLFSLTVVLVTTTQSPTAETRPQPSEENVADDTVQHSKSRHEYPREGEERDKKKQPVIDPNGYIIYCPCMGRFGNQADQFLGSLGFAKKLNRTLILPPWRTYKNVPFDEYFRVEPIQKYHRVILAEEFMSTLAHTVWPEGERIGFCWLPHTMEDNNYCAMTMKKGSPFHPFWDGLGAGVNFDKHIVYRFSYNEIEEWQKAYPGDQYPVIALKGAPARYPVEEQYVSLQEYLQWNEHLEAESDKYIQKNLPKEKFVAIHLRNGMDWENVCKLTDENTKSLMSAPQCLGYGSDGPVTKELCLPSENTILRETKQAVESVGATVVYVATDKNPMLKQLRKTLDGQVRIFHNDPLKLQVDMIIMAKADHLIANCISSFSALPVRERSVKNKTSSFWGFENWKVEKEEKVKKEKEEKQKKEKEEEKRENERWEEEEEKREKERWEEEEKREKERWEELDKVNRKRSEEEEEKKEKEEEKNKK